MEIMTLTGKYWDKEFRDWIISVGFIQSPTSPVIFTKTEPDGIMLIIIFHTALMMDYMLVNQKELLTCLKINYQQDSMSTSWAQHIGTYLQDSTDKRIIKIIDQSRYSNSVVRYLLNSAGVKIVNPPQNYNHPMYVITTIEDNTSTT
jgi:hypothetical protein